MVKAATKSGMFARTDRRLSPPPSRDAFTLPDPHALATGSGLLATAPIFPSPHASIARQWSRSLSPRRSSSSLIITRPLQPDKEDGREGWK